MSYMPDDEILERDQEIDRLRQALNDIAVWDIRVRYDKNANLGYEGPMKIARAALNWVDVET